MTKCKLSEVPGGVRFCTDENPARWAVVLSLPEQFDEVVRPDFARPPGNVWVVTYKGFVASLLPDQDVWLLPT